MNRQGIVIAVLLIVVLIGGFVAGRVTQGVPIGLDGSSLPAAVTNTGDPQGAPQQGGTTIDTSNLTEGQRGMLEALGIDADNITITQEMIECAEAELGAARVDEIRNGATPSFSEGAALLGCYQ